MMREAKTSFYEAASPDDISQLFLERGGEGGMVLGAGFLVESNHMLFRIVELEYDRKMNCF